MRQRTIAALATVAMLLAGCSARTTTASPSAPPSSSASTTPAPTPTPAPATPPEAAKPAEAPKPPKRQAPQPLKGIHFSGWYAGSPDLSAPLLKWAKEAGLNTLVLDVKAEDGLISWNSDIPLAKEIGSNGAKIGDLPKAIKEYHDMGFWVVGRIVTMNDKFLYRARPSETIPGFNGGDYSFMNPASELVYEYNMDIAREAVKAGIDEIQWDYIRYPYQKEAQPFMDAHTTRESRIEAINNFIRKSVKELHTMDVPVSVDVFGLTTSVEEGDDMKIGQDYRSIAQIADRIQPMAYPSHYALGTYGLDNPNAEPYETVKRSLTKAILRTPGIDLTKHVVWIQDFSMGGITYGPAEVRAQIKALYDIGIGSYMLWDPSNKYERGMSLDLGYALGKPPVAPAPSAAPAAGTAPTQPAAPKP